MLSAVTYNIFIGRHLDQILIWLSEKHATLDLICFQEFPEDKVGEIKTFVKQRGYDVVFSAGMTMLEKTFGELTIFNAKKLNLLKAVRIPLGGKGDIMWLATFHKSKLVFEKSHVDRSALYTKFMYGKQTVTLINTHLTANHLNYRRLRQVRKILDNVSDEPTIILGDFNYPFGKLTKVMTDQNFQNATWGLRATHRFAFIALHLDYIFHKQCQIDYVHMEKVHLSDHYPIFFKIALSPIKS